MPLPIFPGLDGLFSTTTTTTLRPTTTTTTTTLAPVVPTTTSTTTTTTTLLSAYAVSQSALIDYLAVPHPNTNALPKGLSEHPEWYTPTPTGWNISAAGSIPPLTLKRGERPPLLPVLEADGVIIRIDGRYLVSPKTKVEIEDDNNPHYDIIENGMVLGTSIGRTIPILDIDIVGLKALGDARDVVNQYAAIKGVDYIYETELIAGFPRGLIEQINYTLNPNRIRPSDTFYMWDLQPTGDYSVAKLTIETNQKEGRLDIAKLNGFLLGIKSRLQALRSDFNAIKDIYYGGRLPEGVRNTIKITRRAQTNDPDQDAKLPYTTVTSGLVGVVPTGLTATTTTTTTVPPPSPLVTTTTTRRPTGNTNTNTTAGGSNRIRAKWRAYGFNAVEAASLTDVARPAPDNTPNTVLVDGVAINTDIVWNPTVCTKARVVGVITTDLNLFGSTTTHTPEEQTLIDYFGIIGNPTDYARLNRERKADLLLLADRINDISNTP